MIFKQDPPEFRPIHITLEDKDDFDMLQSILWAVKENKINHTPQLIRAASEIWGDLTGVEDAP